MSEENGFSISCVTPEVGRRYTTGYLPRGKVGILVGLTNAASTATVSMQLDLTGPITVNNVATNLGSIGSRSRVVDGMTHGNPDYPGEGYWEFIVDVSDASGADISYGATAVVDNTVVDQVSPYTAIIV